MTSIPYIPETAPFSAEQRAWLNGFLAGLFANGMAPLSPAPQATARPAEPLLILFGSQTGTAEGLAKRFATQARQQGFAPEVLALNDVQQAALCAAGKVLIVCSTWGEGDPPDNAAGFWSWLNAESAPRLQRLQYAVLGLGDRNYPDFCGASRKFDARLAELGANRLVPLGECDVEYETLANQWIESVWPKLVEKSTDAVHSSTPSQSNGEVNAPSQTAALGSEADSQPVPRYGKQNPFPGRLLRNILLNKPGSTKEVRHYELDLQGSDLTYLAGDALGVFPLNCPELVDQIIAALRSKAEEPVMVSGVAMPLREALSRHLDITKPSQELVAAVAKAAPETELASLLGNGKPDELKSWLLGRGVIDLLHMVTGPFALGEFLSLLKKLAPRLYSISSSPKAHPQQVHLTVSSVRYQSHGLGRKGVASTFLADRVGDAEVVRFFVQPSSFKPPASGDNPMIMIGPGTGVAPFRAFLQERQATGAAGKNWLFFGDQTRAADFLYETQLTSWQKEGLLTRLDLAFSRDQAEKVYVQHRLLENSAHLWAWLEEGAHVYVCGDASRMAKDVDDALHRIIESAGGKTPEQAKAFVSKMRADKRYQRDVY
jgi:sulfite reductase (NADPH) flavoprotein alpha-component